MAVLIQYQSAKLGLVTGQSLPELIGRRLPPRRRRAFWVQAEVVAATTDVAEVIGGAVALNLLFGTPLILGGLIMGAASMVLLTLQTRNRQHLFERAVLVLLAVIAAGFTARVIANPRRLARLPRGWYPAWRAPTRFCWPPACSVPP